jgi:hypothetical protein
MINMGLDDKFHKLFMRNKLTILICVENLQVVLAEP